MGRSLQLATQSRSLFLVNKGDLIITSINSTKSVFHGRELFQVGYHL